MDKIILIKDYKYNDFKKINNINCNLLLRIIILIIIYIILFIIIFYY
jgi:hypothetical protein